MQKKIIALAIAAAFAAPVAMAADTVTVYGSLDGGLRSATGAGTTMNTFGSGTYNSNRWGIKAVEDLGDGLKANVNLEGSILTGTGETANTKTVTNTVDTDKATSLFDRNSTVGLEGGFGKVDLGRQYSVAFKTVGTYDPFGFKFIKIAGGEAAAMVTRYNNDVSYTGKFGDVTVMAEHAMGDQAVGNDSTATTAVGAGFKSGPINVGGAYSKTKVNSTLNDTAYYTVGGGFDFGAGKVSVGYAKNTIANATADGVSTFTFLGGTFNASSQIGITAGHYRNVVNTAGSTTETTINTTVVGVTYALSKKTALYVEADKKGSDTSGVTTDSNGYSLGLSASF